MQRDWTEPGLSVLEQVMRYQGLSVRQLAKGAGVPVATTARIVNGSKPTLTNAIRLARYLKVRVEDVWG
jgi:plasmid maintenance system antidote protein VapI